MKPAEAIIEKLGGTRAAATLLGLPPSTVQSWKKAGHIPAKQQARVLSAASERRIELTLGDFIQQATA